MTMPAFIDFSLLRNSIIKSNTFVSLLPTPSTLQSIINSTIQTLINCFVSCLAGLHFPEDRNYGFLSKRAFQKNSTHHIFTTYYVPCVVKCFTYFISFNHHNVVNDIILPILQKKK